ncbi:hypothetical protein [Amycolatopsis sp. 195334CR]|uniref:hypothetical protein n=1 Tax=Amycolatopsis sp. 195334CR TaxID=2814588 RepID=UPI001A8E7AB5|nr:hypothetical protein [Amycolatopsis sp. 195334CR]MBN6034025.1 hypothetical protein [Amycolatopsis sp. 195334CR]
MGNGFGPGEPSIGLPDISLPDISLPDVKWPWEDEQQLPPLQLPEKPGDECRYPEEAAQVIRDLANRVGKSDAIEKLDYVKKMLGDFGKVDRIANTWAADTTMNETMGDIDDARQDLATYWSGGGFDAVNTHMVNLSKANGTNQGLITSLGNTLAKCNSEIFKAYKDGITLIFNTAADVIALGLNSFMGAEKAAGKAIDLLTNFVKSVGTVVGTLLTVISGLKEQGVFVAGVASGFQPLAESPQAASAPGLWQVKPVGA